MTVEDRAAAESPLAPAVVFNHRPLHGRGISRRRLLYGVVSAAPLIPLARRLAPFGDSDEESAGADALRQDGTDIEATPPVEPDATPTFDPAASPTADGLQIVSDQRPTYLDPLVAGGALRLLLARAIGTDFNPTTLRQDGQIAASYLDPLVWVDEVTLEPRPWLAESWAWNGDGTEITYDLRRDVRWHDGTPFTAEDVRFSFYVYRDDTDSVVRNLFALMREAEVLDEFRLRVRLNEPESGWIFNASSQLIFQREQYRTYWSNQAAGARGLSGFDWGANLPLGTGPWQLSERRERRLVFTRNDDYFAGPPHFATLDLSVYENPAARLERWRDGFADLLWLDAPVEVEAIREAEGTLHVADAAEVMFAAFNFGNPARVEPLYADVRVRLALSLAIDRSTYASEIFGGFIHHERAGTIAQPWANDPALTNPAQDLPAARRLLTEAGWLDRDGDGQIEDADGKPLTLVAILRDDSRPELGETLGKVGEDLLRLGIGLEVQPLDPTAFRQRWTVARDYDLIAFAYTLYPGFTDFDLYGSDWDIRTNPRGFNPGGYANPTADAAIAAAATATDIPTLRRALRDLQRTVNDDLFGLWLGFPRDLVVVRPDILGFQPNKVWQTWDTRKLWRRSE